MLAAAALFVGLAPAHSGGGGFGEFLPADHPILQAQRRVLEEFRVPVLSGTTVVVHQPGGLSLLTRADSYLWALATTQDNLEGRTPPGPDQVIAAIPAEVPLRAVVHAAGVGAGDAPLTELTLDQLGALLRPKITAAWHLHELTRDLDLDAFVLFSSGAAIWGSGGQPGYAAGNAFLNALAEYRRGQGLTATSLAWGAWAEAGMLAGSDLERLAAAGMPALTNEQAIQLFDAAQAIGEPLILPVRLDLPVLRGRGEVQPLLRGLVRTRTRRASRRKRRWSAIRC